MDCQGICSLSWMAKEHYHYYGWPQNDTIILRGLRNITTDIDGPGVDCYYNPWSIFLIIITAITVDGQGAL